MPRVSRGMAWLFVLVVRVVRSGLDKCSVFFSLLWGDDRGGADKAPTGIIAIFCPFSLPHLHAISTGRTDIARILSTSPRLPSAIPHDLSRSKWRGVSRPFTFQTLRSSQRQEYSSTSGHSYCPSTTVSRQRHTVLKETKKSLLVIHPHHVESTSGTLEVSSRC